MSQPNCRSDGEIGDGRFRSGQDDQPGVARHRLVRADEDEIDAGIEPQRIEVVEVGDAGIDEDGDANAAIAACRLLVLQDHRVLGRQTMCRLEERHQAQRAPPGALAHRLHAVVEQRGIAAEAVDDEAHDHRRHRRHRSRSWCRPGLRSRRRGRCRPPARRARRPRAQSPCWRCRSSRRLTSDAEPAPSTSTRSHSAAKRPKLSSTAPQELGLQSLVLARLGVAQHLALHHDLRADIALGLQQHRVHVDAERDARRRAPAAPGRGRSRRRRR